jgi:tetratricopeptide (TPR) repeat protein
MGRSIAEGPSLVPATFYHRLSNRHYTISSDSIRRHQLDVEGHVINLIEKPITLAIGSGNHAITYVNRTPQGRLLELPISWYAKLGGYAMSPGYDRADHLDFRREINASCLFCHSTGAEPAPIECRRCHGSTEAHRARPAKGNILNPARVPTQRQLEICLQCHLETASQGITDSLLRPGRAVFSFRPGEPLADYKLYFDRADAAGDDRFEINHAGYRLLQSRCYRESGGRMTCTTCHDPHSASVRPDSCVQCHTRPHTDGECSGCHMPRRIAYDAIHTEMTDHKIVRRPQFRDPVRESNTPYDGRVVDFYTKSDPLALALANLRAPDPDVYRRYLQRDPDNVPVLVALGKLLLRRNEPRTAAQVIEKATRLDPRDTNALDFLAVAEAVQGNHKKALTILQRAIADNPDDALCWINLGNTYEALGEFRSAKDAYEEAIRLQPDSSEARRRRNGILARLQR